MHSHTHQPGDLPIDTGAEAWEAIYQADDAGWDLGAVSPPLTHLAAAGSLPSGAGLVLGCGTGHEVLWLRQQGYDAMGVDFAPSAVTAARQRLPADEANRILAADALSLGKSHPSHWSWLFDQTFFCALQPDQRAAYAETIAAILQPQGLMIALSMRTTFSERPPYDSTPGTYINLLENVGFRLVEARRLDQESHQRRRGRETLVIMQKTAT